ADKRFARLEVVPDPTELFLRQGHAPDKKNDQVSLLERVQARNVFAPGCFKINTFVPVSGFQILLERRQGLGRLIFGFTRDENNRRRARSLPCLGCLNREKEKRQKDRPIDRESAHGFARLIMSRPSPVHTEKSSKFQMVAWRIRSIRSQRLRLCPPSLVFGAWNLELYNPCTPFKYAKINSGKSRL